MSNGEYGELVDEVEYPQGLNNNIISNDAPLKESRNKSPDSYVPSRFTPFLSVLPCYNMSKRYQIAFLSSLGFLISFGIRCNMGVAVVVMVHEQIKYDKYGNKTIIVNSGISFYAPLFQSIF